ncbi:MAG: ABC transporter ATP-binding protein [Acutalibacter sp.]|jgi:ABC-2 type transport system ATP-binding protein
MENAIELRNLRKNYKYFTLDNISLTLPMGCILGFIGENGAGKSTTIKAMLGLIHIDGGEIRLLGKDPSAHRSVMEEVGMVLDSGFFPPEMNAKQLEKSLSHIFRNWDQGTYYQYLQRFEIPLEKKVKEYSRGMVMKFSLTVALSHQAKLLILDEATSGLDPIIRDDILDILYDFIQDEQHSVFLSSHITADLEKIADYIAFIHKGKLIMCGEKDTLLETYGLFHCSKDQLAQLDPSAVAGYRQNEFGVTALVKRYRMPGGCSVEHASLDDIMLYSIKGRHH